MAITLTHAQHYLPSVIAPSNSKKPAQRSAYFNLIAPDPTLVPHAFAASGVKVTSWLEWTKLLLTYRWPRLRRPLNTSLGI